MPLYNFRKDKDKIKDSMGKKFDGIQSGIKTLDNLIIGFGKGELSTIGGRTGEGKSSLARDILLYNGRPDKELGMNILWTMEMPCWNIADLLAATISRVNYREVQKGIANDKVLKRFAQASESIFNYNIMVNDDARCTPGMVKDLVMRVSQEYPIASVIVDYLQLMSLTKPAENRQAEIETISKELKLIAMEFNIPVIALSQLNRKSEYRESSRPRIEDIRGSGAMGNDSTKIILIHRPGYSDRQFNPEIEDTGDAELIVCKQRSGKTGIAECTFIAEWTSFKDTPNEAF